MHSLLVRQLEAFERISCIFPETVNSNPEIVSLMECHESVRVRQGGHMAVAAGGFFSGGVHDTGDELMSMSLSDCRCTDRCGVAIHTHQVVSETTITTTTTTTSTTTHHTPHTTTTRRFHSRVGFFLCSLLRNSGCRHGC